MSIAKTAVLTVRIEPNIKEALRAAAFIDHRSISNMVAVMIRRHCEQNGIDIKLPHNSDQSRESSQ